MVNRQSRHKIKRNQSQIHYGTTNKPRDRRHTTQRLRKYKCRVDFKGTPTSMQKITLKLLTLPEKPQIMDVSNSRPKRTSDPTENEEAKRQIRQKAGDNVAILCICEPRNGETKMTNKYNKNQASGPDRNRNTDEEENRDRDNKQSGDEQQT